MLPGQFEHSVGDDGSFPAGQDTGTTHSDDPSKLNLPSGQGEQSSLDAVSLKVLAPQGAQALSEVAPVVALAFPASHARQVSMDSAEVEELQKYIDVRLEILCCHSPYYSPVRSSRAYLAVSGAIDVAVLPFWAIFAFCT